MTTLKKLACTAGLFFKLRAVKWLQGGPALTVTAKEITDEDSSGDLSPGNRLKR